MYYFFLVNLLSVLFIYFYYLCYYAFRQGYKRAYIIQVRDSSTIKNMEKSSEKVCNVGFY